jgi:delta 1-pyrroline-5-carboxylate dehydrogenase
MAVFMFSLTPVACHAETSMIYDALQRRFPRHRFHPIQTDEPELENSIVPLVEPGDRTIAGMVHHALVNEVEIAFQELVSATKGWRPS